VHTFTILLANRQRKEENKFIKELFTRLLQITPTLILFIKEFFTRLGMVKDE
jgi:hypothetical protein